MDCGGVIGGVKGPRESEEMIKQLPDMTILVNMYISNREGQIEDSFVIMR